MTTQDCARTFQWGDQAYTFNLDHPWVRNVLAIRGLPGQFGDTPAACFERFDKGVYSTDDVERILELGLIGGGMTRGDARRAIDQNVQRSPIAPNAKLAFEILAALFFGVTASADASA